MLDKAANDARNVFERINDRACSRTPKRARWTITASKTDRVDAGGVCLVHVVLGVTEIGDRRSGRSSSDLAESLLFTRDGADDEGEPRVKPKGCDVSPDDVRRCSADNPDGDTEALEGSEHRGCPRGCGWKAILAKREVPIDFGLNEFGLRNAADREEGAEREAESIQKGCEVGARESPHLEHMHGRAPCAFGVVYERPVPVTREDRRAWAVGRLQPPRPAGLGRFARCAHVPSR